MKLAITNRLKKHKYRYLAAGSVLMAVLTISIIMYLNFPKDQTDSQVNQTNKESVSTTKVPVTPNPKPSANPTPATQTPIQNANAWPITLTNEQAGSLTAVVNKKHKLPESYVPQNLTNFMSVLLRNEASVAASKLSEAALAAGHNIKAISGYRSYSTQASVYNNYVSRDGQALADTYSARPGHSEHQTGLAVDFGNSNGSCDLETCFGDSALGKWLSANAANFGFIIRYPSGKESITGYQYEPWHLRYLGVDLAKSVTNSGKTLDEYFGVPAGDYQ